MNDIYKKLKNILKSIEEYNPNKKRKIFIVFDDMVADMIANKNLNPVVTELVIRGRKLNISFFYHMIIFYCTKKCQDKFYTLCYQENPKQTRTSTSSI